MKVLGIETSCDETAVAVIDFDSQRSITLLSNVVASSMDLHKAFGGVVPEIAARSHIEAINPAIETALSDAFTDQSSAGRWKHIDAIAVTYGAGLGGSLLIGVMTARTLAIIKNKPLYAVNHVMAHPFASFINKSGSKLKIQGTKLKLPEEQPEFPMLTLIVSGGHSQLVLFENPFDYKLLGQTRDDAVGEAFDKVAKILGLSYPGGPAISQSAKSGNPLPSRCLSLKWTIPMISAFLGSRQPFCAFYKRNVANHTISLATSSLVSWTRLPWQTCLRASSTRPSKHWFKRL